MIMKGMSLSANIAYSSIVLVMRVRYDKANSIPHSPEAEYFCISLPDGFSIRF